MKRLFKITTLGQIRFWTWTAMVLPLFGVAGMFFLWALGYDTLLQSVMVIGATAMFAVSVIWWWWALYTFQKLITHWDHTSKNMEEVSKEVKEIKSIFREVFFSRKDK